MSMEFSMRAGVVMPLGIFAGMPAGSTLGLLLIVFEFVNNCYRTRLIRF